MAEDAASEDSHKRKNQVQAASQSDREVIHENMINTVRRSAIFGTNLGKYEGIPNLFFRILKY